MAGHMWDIAVTPIGQAIEAGDVDKVNSLISSGENVHFRDKKKNTYIHYVCTMYRPSVFYALVAAGIDISAQNKHGNTALHVTALQKECCHVGDLMCCGVDPAIKNKFGKTAEELGTQNKYWYMIYERYKKLFGPNYREGPGIFQAVEEHDLPKIQELLNGWVRVDVVRNGQTLRQHAALLTYHDIVVLIDQHRPTIDMIYGVFEGNHEKVKEALNKTRCQVNFLNQISVNKHILQHAIKFHDCRFVRMLCDAGADVNLQIRVHNYFSGPLYFEAFHKDVPLNIKWKVLKSGADFTRKDERGRTAFMYALDKANEHIPIEMFKYMIEHGTDITQRDCTGCTVRDIARFARRRDVVDLIDKHYIKIIRSSDVDALTQMAVHAYDSLIINFNYRDTFIFASGNETDDAVKFVEWMPKFQDAAKKIHIAVNCGSANEIKTLLKTCVTPELVINARNKALRTPLMAAVLRGYGDIVTCILNQPHTVELNARDWANSTAYHFACGLPAAVGEIIQHQLVEAGADSTLQDVKGRVGKDYTKMSGREEWLQKEQKAVYGMETELDCVDKYEALCKIIKAKKKGVAEFMDYIKSYRFPVVALHKVLSPLMPKYRDLIFVAVDYGKEDIVYKLTSLGADLSRQEQYEKTSEDGTKQVNHYTPAERAQHLAFDDLADFLHDKQTAQLKKVRNHETLLSQRTMLTHFEHRIQRKGRQSVFVTQSETDR